MGRSPTASLLLAATLIFCSSIDIVVAQTAQPTAEQMRLINQLPHAQREKALSALRQMQSENASGESQSSLSEPLTELTPESLPEDELGLLESLELLASGRGQVVIHFIPNLTLTADELESITEDPVLSRILGSHFYTLDENAVLNLPGLAEIPLMGLNDAAIMQRLGAEPA